MPGNPTIEDWLDGLIEGCKCWWCGVELYGRREVHHVERRSHAPRDRRDHPANLFVTCPECHRGVLDFADQSQVLARKMLRDPENFDLKTFLRIADPSLNAPERISLREIVKHLEVKR